MSITNKPKNKDGYSDFLGLISTQLEEVSFQLSKAQSDNLDIQQAIKTITSLKQHIDSKINERQNQIPKEPNYDRDNLWPWQQ